MGSSCSEEARFYKRIRLLNDSKTSKWFLPPCEKLPTGREASSKRLNPEVRFSRVWDPKPRIQAHRPNAVVNPVEPKELVQRLRPTASMNFSPSVAIERTNSPALQPKTDLVLPGNLTARNCSKFRDCLTSRPSMDQFAMIETQNSCSLRHVNFQIMDSKIGVRKSFHSDPVERKAFFLQRRPDRGRERVRDSK